MWIYIEVSFLWLFAGCFTHPHICQPRSEPLMPSWRFTLSWSCSVVPSSHRIPETLRLEKKYWKRPLRLSDPPHRALSHVPPRTSAWIWDTPGGDPIAPCTTWAPPWLFFQRSFPCYPPFSSLLAVFSGIACGRTGLLTSACCWTNNPIHSKFTLKPDWK